MLIVPAVVHHLTRRPRAVFVQVPAGHALVPVDVIFCMTALLVMMFHGYHT